MNKALLIAGALLAATQAQAAATSDMSISIDWNTMVITGPLGNLSSFTDPMTGDSFSTDGEGWVGSDYNRLNSAYAIDGASAMTSFNNGSLDLEGGYDAITNNSSGNVTITNTGSESESGWAGAFRGFIYQASGTGMVTVSVDYSLIGNVSTSSWDEYANAGYDFFFDAVDADLWLSTFNTELASSGDLNAAETAAELAATLNSFSFADWQLLECWSDGCSASVNQSDILSISFDVVAGKNYFFGAEAGVTGYTYVSSVPVPAAVWLFGSGLLGLAGLARRKKV